MTIRPLLWLAVPLLFAVAVPAQEKYEEPVFPAPPEATLLPGVPEGTIQRFTLVSKERVFPGTVRRYWVYVPQQYDAAKPAALMVFQDGHAYVNRQREFRTPNVMDNLIAKGGMPVTIGIFINPGVFAESLPDEDGWNSPQGVKSNRSVEYDTPSPAYVTFLEKELLPEIAKS